MYKEIISIGLAGAIVVNDYLGHSHPHIHEEMDLLGHRSPRIECVYSGTFAPYHVDADVSGMRPSGIL